MSDVVKYFHSDMAGAPQMSNGLGQMISVLDNCLINGFNSLTPSSITRSGSTATATFGTAHGYEVDQVLLVFGCDQTAYNGEMRVLSVPTSTTLTFAVVGTPTTPATTATSFNAKAAPLGFAKIFSGTNKAMYQSQNVSTNQWVLRLDGTAWTDYSTGKGVEYKVDICRAATDINTMVENTTASPAQFGRFRWRQTAASGVIFNAAPSSTVNWALYGNDKTFFLVVGWHSSYPLCNSIYGFGEVVSYKAGDAYSTFLMADNVGAVGGVTNQGLPTTSGFRAEFNKSSLSNAAPQSDIVLAKAYNGVGSWTQGGFCTLGSPTSSPFISGYQTGIAAVNPQDFSILFNKVLVSEGDGFRGEFLGIYSIPNQLNDISTAVDFNGQKYTQSAGGAAKTLRVCRTQYINALAYVAFDITGPW